MRFFFCSSPQPIPSPHPSFLFCPASPGVVGPLSFLPGAPPGWFHFLFYRFHFLPPPSLSWEPGHLGPWGFGWGHPAYLQLLGALDFLHHPPTPPHHPQPGVLNLLLPDCPAPVLGVEPGNRDNRFRKETAGWGTRRGEEGGCRSRRWCGDKGRGAHSALPLSLPEDLDPRDPRASLPPHLWQAALPQHTWVSGTLPGSALAGFGRVQAGSRGLRGLLSFRGKQTALPWEGSRLLL